MAIDLRNENGATIRISSGHWAVYLTLAETFGWRPAGTRRPRLLAPEVEWSGRYDSSDGQVVPDAEAKQLAQILHAAAVSPKIGQALFDVIAHIESQVENTGTTSNERDAYASGRFQQGVLALIDVPVSGRIFDRVA